MSMKLRKSSEWEFLALKVIYLGIISFVSVNVVEFKSITQPHHLYGMQRKSCSLYACLTLLA